MIEAVALLSKGLENGRYVVDYAYNRGNQSKDSIKRQEEKTKIRYSLNKE